MGLMALWIHVGGRLRFQFTFRSSMYSMVRFFPLDLKAPLCKKKEPSLIKGRHLHAVKHVKNLFNKEHFFLKSLSIQINQERQLLYTLNKALGQGHNQNASTISATALGPTLILLMPSTLGLTYHIHLRP